MNQPSLPSQDIQTLRHDLAWLQRLHAWVDQHRLLLIAIIGTIVFHAGLLFNGTLWNTYDAFVHMFFADHYARGWFDLWEERWYTGFTMVSYPPLTHQINALLSFAFGLRGGYIVILLVATVVTTIGVYRFARLWVNERAAGYAALLAVFSSSIAETVHVFGQSPTMFVIGVLLNALPFIWHYVEDGEVRNLLRAWAILMVACAGHHVTTIFGMVFFCGPILATILWRKFRQPLQSEPRNQPLRLRNLGHIVWRRWKRIAPAFIRCGIFGVGFIFIAVLAVLPYWLWSRSDPITQVTIPHGSRENFLIETNIGFMFFVVPWGMLFFLLPYALYKGYTSCNWILAASLSMLALLGTGGTTPIPAFLLRGAFYILTLDRFTFWATIVILPFAGLWVESIIHGRLGKWLTANLGAAWRIAIMLGFTIGLISWSVFVANLTQFRKFQPDPVDVTPIVEFLSVDNHDAWRYMTLGFGDQLAWLSSQTTALNVEGNYHSARRLPEMTSTPIERMDGAKYQAMPGLGTLHQILSNPQRYNLKYIFVNDAFYDPVLHFYGWANIVTLSNGVVVWERADVPPLPSAIPQVDYPDWQRLMWGIVPISSLFVTTTVFIITAFVQIHPSRWWGIRWFARRQWIHSMLVNQPVDTTYQPDNRWQVWRRITDRLSIRLKVRTRRRLYGSLLALIVIGGMAFSLLRVQEELTSPQAIVLNYYDAIDFQRFADSYQWLATDLSQAEYLRYLSLRGGIVASYSKLDNLHMSEALIQGDIATVDVHLEWLTSLGIYEQTETHTLVRTSQGWHIQLDVPVPPVPDETFITVQTPAYYMDLPLPSLETGALNRGVLERSALAVGDVRAVYLPQRQIGFIPEAFEIDRFDGRWRGLVSIVGMVENQDVYPSHITVTAIFYDANGVRLGESNSAAVMQHQLLPGEVTPFRVDFFGAQATSLTDVDVIDNVELIVRGVPTANNLSRPLVLLDETTLTNTGSVLVDIPRLLTTHLGADNKLLWVQNTYLEQAIAPGATQNVTSPTIPATLRVLDIDITTTGPRLADWQRTSTTPLQFTSGFVR